MNYKILPEITEKQKEILKIIIKLRFVNRHQIQKLLHHKDTKRINVWLKDLVNKNYLGRIYSHKLLENTKPAIYFLNNNGITWARHNYLTDFTDEGYVEIKHIRKFYEDKNASKVFISHCVLVSEIYTQFKNYEYLENKNKKNPSIEYEISSKTENWIEKLQDSQTIEEFNNIKQFIPDLFVDKKSYMGKEIKSNTCFMIEVFNPKMPKYAIKHRIKQYIRLKEEKNELIYYLDSNNVFPQIILIFPNYHIMNFYIKFINDELMYGYEEPKITFMLTTYQKITTDTILAGEKIWKFIQEE